MGDAATAGLNRWHALLGLLIAYGSLYPFDFVAPQAWLPALRQMLADTGLWSSPGDVLGNILLFLPWGLATAWQPGTALRRLLPALLAGLVLAAALQVMQIALPSRDAAVSDIVWNTVGLLLGQFALAPLAARLHHPTREHADGQMLAWGLAALWLAGETLPFIPSLDLAQIRGGLKAFVAPASPSSAVLLGAFAGVLTLGHLALTHLPRRRAQAGLLLLLPVLVLSRILIIHNDPHWLELVAGIAAWGAVILLRTPQRIAPFAFIAVLGALTLEALQPYVWRMHAASFNWQPFAAYLNGNMLGNLRELLDTVWHIAALLWLAHAMSARVAGVGCFLVVWVLALETAQLWIAGRSADITPVLTTLLVAVVMVRLTRQHRPPRAAPPASGQPEGPSAHSPNARWAALSRASLGWPLAAWFAGSVVLAWLIGQPGVPYNLRELFLGDGHPLAIAAFMLAVLSLGAGPRFAVDLARGARRPALRLPLLLCAGGLVTLLLLTVSVTGESLDDIAGSNNRYWWVTEREVWGAWTAVFFRSYLTPEVVAPVERAVRFLALYLPPASFLAVALAALDLRLPIRRIAAMAAVLLPLLWLCKAVAFDWSSTDNLNELIAPPGEYGLGGGGYLYLLLVLATANIALLVRRTAPRWPGLLFTPAALPLSWWLLKQGLAEAVNKYELVYSGPQFLLGPDRRHLLDEDALFGRWTVLYLALLATVAAGVILARRLQPASASRSIDT